MKHKSPKRARVYDAGFNFSSEDEEDLDIDVTCHASSGDIAYSYSLSKTKRIRKTAKVPQSTILSYEADSISGVQQEDTSPSNDCPDREHSKCKQGASVMMSAFMKELPTIHESLLSKEYDRDLDHGHCECGSREAKYRCRSCTQVYLRCRGCILKDHHLSAWHHLEEWVGSYFVRTSLSSLGYRHRLGHRGKRCPNRSPASPIRKMVIVHINGFHEVPVEFCACNDTRTHFYQLFDAELFPATIERPETAFTQELLDAFQKLSLRSKINAYDYHRSLQEMTNAAFAEDVPNRYHEFVRVCRLWDHMAQERRSGQCHGFDDAFPHRRQGSIAVRCPACPEIHVNVDKSTIELAGEDETHKYTLFLSVDGNFKLRRKNKRGDPDDVSLNDGRGYFVAASPYAMYLEHTTEERDEECVCAHLRALRFRNLMRFKNADVSGVVVVQCARHGFYQPEGMADLKRGEANVDYVIARALADAHDQRWIMFTYDIWCSYQKNIKQRFDKWFSQMLPTIKKVRGAVPKMHIKNHKINCQYCWSLNYLQYSGETTGELIEACHSEQNGAAASTKEQNAGHRHDSLDGVVNYWNWTKFPLSLYRSFVRCLDTLKTREKQFLGFTARFAPTLLREWAATDDAPKIIQGEIHSVHRPKFTKGPPTCAMIHEKLLFEECAREKAGLGGSGVTENVRKALDLEQEQWNIKILAKKGNNSEADGPKLLWARQRLRHELDEWRAEQTLIFPKLSDEFQSKVLDSLHPFEPEDEPLLLPSTFSEPHRRYLGLELCANTERELRLGRAHDRLEDVRTAIQTYNHHVALKAKEVRSQRHITRAQNIINELKANILSPARRYNMTRAALIDLGLPEGDPVLRELKDHELWAKNSALPAQLGDSRKEDPWFWHASCPSGTSTEKAEFQCEMDRVKYFRDRSLRNRAREEREILEEEFKRTIRYYDGLQSAWITQGAAKDLSPGHMAYAQKQAAMFAHLSRHCTKYHARALQKAREYDTWFEDLQRSQEE